jgi:hypothetical protein
MGERISFRVYHRAIFHAGFNEILFVSIALRVVEFFTGFQITLTIHIPAWVKTASFAI